MTKNLYYRTIYSKKSSILDALAALIFNISLFPRILLEVFIRKNFGERYFKLTPVIWLVFVLFWVPYLRDSFLSRGSFYQTNGLGDAIVTHWSWYIFLAVFLYVCIQRKLEIVRSKKIYDFTRFSLYEGDHNPALRGIKIGQKETDIRDFECYVEPAAFFLVGVLLILFHQLVGVLLLLSSVIYSLSYKAAYRQGDAFVLDVIDEMIASKNIHASFVDGLNANQTQGFRVKGRGPADPEFRRQVADETIVEDSGRPTFAM
jgi:hypothetical protein